MRKMWGACTTGPYAFVRNKYTKCAPIFYYSYTATRRVLKTRCCVKKKNRSNNVRFVLIDFYGKYVPAQKKVLYVFEGNDLRACFQQVDMDALCGKGRQE